MIERVYNVPLRKGFIQTARYKKTKKAVSTLKEFLVRHLKQKDPKKILIGKVLNEELWKHGIKNPPRMVKITVIKEDDGTVKAELYGHAYGHMKKSEKEAAEKKEDKKKDTKTEDKVKADKEKSTGAEKKHEHMEHMHESSDVHKHDEKHEHASRTHEARPELATPKKNSKK